MRRRLTATAAAQPFPPHLAHYHRADWTGLACHPECAWWQARDAWEEDHPELDFGLLPPDDAPAVPLSWPLDPTCLQSLPIGDGGPPVHEPWRTPGPTTRTAAS